MTERQKIAYAISSTYVLFYLCRNNHQVQTNDPIDQMVSSVKVSPNKLNQNQFCYNTTRVFNYIEAAKICADVSIKLKNNQSETKRILEDIAQWQLFIRSTVLQRGYCMSLVPPATQDYFKSLPVPKGGQKVSWKAHTKPQKQYSTIIPFITKENNRTSQCMNKHKNSQKVLQMYYLKTEQEN